MASKESVGSQTSKAGSPPFLNWGQEQTEAAMSLQKALLESCDQASRSWLARVQSEVSLWSVLSRSILSLFEERFAAYANGCGGLDLSWSMNVSS